VAERAHPDDPAFRGTIYEACLRERYAFCLPFVHGRDVLDVPCGTGWGSSLLSGYVSLTGLDIDHDAIDYARKHYAGIRFIEGSMCQLPFEDASFDTVVCLEGLEHVYLSDAQRFLHEAHRVLREHGILVVTAPLLNNGRHSSNPYHLYEFVAAELKSLLSRYFIPIHWEIIQGGDGPEARFVGQRKAVINAGAFRMASSLMFDRVYDWVLSLTGERGVRFTAGGEESIIATSCAVLILEGIDRLQDVSSSLRNQWIAYLQSCQRPTDGLFVDPLLERFPIESAIHDQAYLLDQTTYLALQALDALGSAPIHPISVQERWPNPQAFIAWMERLDWSNAWLQSNRVMFALAFLVHAVEQCNQREAASIYHAALDWLDATQDRETGVWGTRHGASLLNGMAAAYHFLPFYEYVCRPIQCINQLIDTTLALQQSDGLFGSGLGGGACEDLDAIGVLAVAARYSRYRAEEVKRAAIRAFWALWNAQNEDGGFGYAIRSDDQVYRFSSWGAAESRVCSSDVWSSLARLVALGTIRHWFPDDTPSLPLWRFRRLPVLGYHRSTDRLDDNERARLKIWMRPLPAPERHTGTEPGVSVIIPCYNLGRYLYEALASALQQTLQPLEVIVVDDGSTDDYTRLVLDTIDHPQVRVIRQENRGLPAARNAGIRMARSPFICCLDADDRLLPTYFERVLPLLESDPQVGFVTSHYREFDGRSGVVAPSTCALPDMLVVNRAIVTSLFRREAWERAGGYCEELSGMHDWDLWIGILEAGYRAEIVPEILFEYRVRPGSMYATTSQPENYARLVGRIVERHAPLYQHWWRDVVVLYARERASLVAYAEWQGRLALQINSNGAQQAENWKRLAEDRAAWIGQLEEARDHNAQQAENWRRLAEDRAAWIGQLEEARDYNAQQAENWKRLAEERATWIAQLEEARDYNAQQAENWRRLAEDRAAWIGQLEEARDYNAQQAENWKRLAEDRAVWIEQIRRLPWYRIMAKLGIAPR
jgi:glycosyltransferase involved in cell wall biosynthesis/SAM-dependent methyltransferase